MIDIEEQNSLRAQYNPDGSQLRRAQLRMVDLLKFIDNICREHNLRYWIAYGTLIGAMRHGGFIPWDDDADICMPREDALKLKKIMANKVWDGHIVLQTPDTDPKFNTPSWYVVRDLKSEYIQDSWAHKRLKYRGLQVDIFIVEENLNPTLSNISRLMGLTGILWPSNNVFHFGCFRPLLRFNYNLLEKAILPLFRLFHTNDNTIRAGLGTSFKLEYPRDAVYPLSRICFEGVELNAPGDPEKILTIRYGDWDKVPTVEERVTHDADFKFFE